MVFDSMDDIIDYSKRISHYHSASKITPEVDFMVHCSNLQAWVENGYDTRVLSKNLAFPLLKEIAKYDPKAKMILAEEICERFFKGTVIVQNYLINTGCVDLVLSIIPLEFAEWINIKDNNGPKFQIYDTLSKNFSHDAKIKNQIELFEKNILNPSLFRFRLAGVPHVPLKILSLELERTVDSVRKLLQEDYQVNPVLSVHLIFKGKVLRDDVRLGDLGFDFNKDCITVMASGS